MPTSRILQALLVALIALTVAVPAAAPANAGLAATPLGQGEVQVQEGPEAQQAAGRKNWIFSS